MAKFIIETAARASIREYWRVDATSEEEAREIYGEQGECLYDEVLGHEEDRGICQVHTEADLATFFAAELARKEAPAMVQALRSLLGVLSDAFGNDECDAETELGGYIFGDVMQDAYHDARAILSRIDGEG